MILVKLHGWIVILTIQQIENEQIGYCSSEIVKGNVGALLGIYINLSEEYRSSSLVSLISP